MLAKKEQHKKEKLNKIAIKFDSQESTLWFLCKHLHQLIVIHCYRQIYLSSCIVWMNSTRKIMHNLSTMLMYVQTL